MPTSKNSRDIGVVEVPKGSGTWHARVVYQGRQYWRRAANKTHARELYQEMKVQIRKGEFPPRQQKRSVPFVELLRAYRAAKHREGKAVMASEIGYARLLQRFAGKTASEISVNDVDCWRLDLAESLAPATVNLHLCLLRAILRYGVRSGQLPAAAIPQIDSLKTNNKLVRYLTEDEEIRLLSALPMHLRPLVALATHTGMRKGELLNLRWSDVDLVSGTITVREAKSGEGRRLPLSETASQAIRGLKVAQGPSSQNDSHVFRAPLGGALMNLNRDWYRALRQCSLANFRFHDLRHTFASRLVMSGVDLYRVQTLMGHKTPAVTLRYAHLSPQHLRAAVVLLNRPGAKPWSDTSGRS